jgi:hypothetical protein
VKNLEVMPNLMPEVATRQEYIIALDPACPVSGNPKKGSSIKIGYSPKLWHLEVYSLRAFIEQFKGGLSKSVIENIRELGYQSADEDDYPTMAPYVVRDQEHMIQYVAQACADAVGVEVEAVAQLILSDGVSTSEMRVDCVAVPDAAKYGIAPVSRFAK